MEKEKISCNDPDFNLSNVEFIASRLLFKYDEGQFAVYHNLTKVDDPSVMYFTAIKEKTGYYFYLAIKFGTDGWRLTVNPKVLFVHGSQWEIYTTFIEAEWLTGKIVLLKLEEQNKQSKK